VIDDETVRRAFDSLRKEDARRAPTFDAIVHRKMLPARPIRLNSPLSALAVVLLIFGLGIGYWHLANTRHDSSPLILAWRAPTDFLLDTPRSPLMNGVPRIGVAPPPALGRFAEPSTPSEPNATSEPERRL
jgi:hypothetical protein